MLSRDSGWSELALCFINNLNTHTHKHTHARTHTYTLLLSNAQNAEINTILSAFEIHNTCERTRRQEPHPRYSFPCRPVLWEKETGGCSVLSAVPHKVSSTWRTPTAASPTPHQRGPSTPLPEQAEPCNARGNPWSSDTPGHTHGS